MRRFWRLSRSPRLFFFGKQDNRLEEIPEEIFRLPSLTVLDVSNNKLVDLPFEMWRSPKLKELNAAFNLLKELPTPSVDVSRGGKRRDGENAGVIVRF